MITGPLDPLAKAREVLALAFIALGLVFVWLEGYGARTGAGTFSDLFRDHVRFDPLGRPLSLALACWIGWHLFVQPMTRVTGITWRDALAILVGLAWAAIELRCRIGTT